MRNWITKLVLLVLFLSAPLLLLAQATNGSIAGTIVDTTGAAVSGATVTATDIQTNIGRSATTSKVGGYRIESVQPGTYKIVVTAPSFATTTIEHIDVSASVVTSANATLGVGSINSTIEVAAVTAGLQTNSGELSDTLTLKEVSTLPISSLNPYALATTLPGVTTVTAGDFTNGTSFSVNGNRPRDNNFLIEGSDNNDQGLHGQAFQPENLEAVQEVTFLLSSFSPEFGGGGAVSNVLFQSGTNHFHGAVFERLLNSSLDATDHSTVLSLQQGSTAGKPKTRENLYGFRIGGPIFRDRAFFFVSTQWDKFRGTSNAGTLTLPTASGYTALNQFASNPRIATLVKAYAGLVGTISSAATSVNLGNDPVTGNPRGTVNFAGVQRTLPNSTNSRELEATSDVNISSADKLRFRFIQSPNETPYDTGNFPDQLPGFDTQQNGIVYNAGITETHVFNQHLLNEVRLSWVRIGFNFDLRPETYANPLALAPAVSIAGITGYGIPAGSVPQGRSQDTYQLQDALSLTLGRHFFKFGFDVADIRIKDGIPFNFYGSIPYQAQANGYTALANYLDDFSGSGNGDATINFGNPTARPVIWDQSYYAQDSWKALPNLELDFGMRYEYHGTPFNYLGFPGFDVNNPAAFPSRVPEVGDKNNFGPRIGFNYQPVAAGKTVISGGFGVFYSHVFSNIIDNIQGSAPNAAAKSIVPGTTGRGTPNWSSILTVCPTCAITTTSATAMDTSNVINAHLLDPITYEYNLRVQHELPGSFVVAAQYVGNRTEKDYATEEFNPTIPGATRLVPTRGRIILEDNEADSNYNGGELDIEHRSRHGLSLRAAYTYSKMLDDGSEIFTDTGNVNGSTYAEIQNTSRAREYAPSLFDHRHRLVVSAVYTPPTWHAQGGARIAAAIANGFTFATITSFQSGQPQNVEIGYDWNGDGIGNDRPILLNKSAPITNWAVKGEDFFDVPVGTLCDGPEFWATSDGCHVVSAANTHWVTSNFGTTQGTVSRNALTTDHTVNTDLTIQRSFKVFKNQSFDIRAEGLNVFNQANTGSYNANLITGVPFNGTDESGNVYTGATTFGNRYLTSTGGRILRFFARYQF
ncbi:carboxypeptidase regulatory-like domain-containing protein [Granulicella mallensis]|uniref:TonB-dependent receptor n=1 Tax=Granulicella mallensis (strain ATCC BAA-1857 / DSM 23137 / MP5ACTX8) TaxID=682795 RepID=G8P0L7_GRAMM|nr:carboxypeptidase regulatory-like domain-containing protein [Granulicella mallensis]AEU34625.1 TonB-dependent receptor [Granulicella mallensis MP5ACTX8]